MPKSILGLATDGAEKRLSDEVLASLERIREIAKKTDELNRCRMDYH
jgi:hypothetical protein